MISKGNATRIENKSAKFETFTLTDFSDPQHVQTRLPCSVNLVVPWPTHAHARLAPQIFGLGRVCLVNVPCGAMRACPLSLGSRSYAATRSFRSLRQTLRKYNTCAQRGSCVTYAYGQVCMMMKKCVRTHNLFLILQSSCTC